MSFVKPKKNLGQHFLRNKQIAQHIVDSLSGFGNYRTVLEVGPGTGVLSQLLMQQTQWNWWGMDVDQESIAYLQQHFPDFEHRILEADFLKADLQGLFEGDKMAIIGNFPYHISSQILFKVLHNRQLVTEMVGMFQDEVARRVVASPGGKTNGILSVLCQAFYKVEYLFQVGAHEFYPPPKVKSAVIRMTRNDVSQLDCDEKLFFQVVKVAFNQRRKTLRNSLKSMQVQWDKGLPDHLPGQRAEQLTVQEFVSIVNAIPA